MSKILQKNHVQKNNLVLLPTKTAADHTFLDLFPGLMMKNARLNFSNSQPSGSCYCQIPHPGEAGSCQIPWVRPIPHWDKPLTGA